VSDALAERRAVPAALAVAVLTTTPVGADDETCILKFKISVTPGGRERNVLQTDPPRFRKFGGPLRKVKPRGTWSQTRSADAVSSPVLETRIR
jgi:hypothetical protein